MCTDTMYLSLFGGLSIECEVNFSGSVIKVSWILNLLICTNSMRREKRCVSLNLHSYQISSLGNCVDDTLTETEIRTAGWKQMILLMTTFQGRKEFISGAKRWGNQSGVREWRHVPANHSPSRPYVLNRLGFQISWFPATHSLMQSLPNHANNKI